MTNECFCGIIEEVINEVSKKYKSQKVTDSRKYIQFLRDVVDRIEDRGEREAAKTELIKQEHKTFPKIDKIEKKEMERSKKEENKKDNGEQ